jgi:hypothetical protein
MNDVIHDILIELDFEPTDEAIACVVKMLPKDIKLEAARWGWSDTCVKDDIFVFVREKGGSFLE